MIKDKKSTIRNCVLKNCTFNGVKFSEEATSAITTIATALLENAKALGQLSYVLKASNVNIETLLKIDHEKDEPKAKS